MKHALKILAIVLTLALVCCAFIFTTSAAEVDSVSTLSEPWQYTDSSGSVKTAASLKTAVSGAKTGSTVKLLADQTVSWDSQEVYITKALTIDLNGHTFMMSQGAQSPIGLSTTSLVTFKNGTLVACGNSSFGTKNTGYAIFRTSTANTNLKLENVNTYSSCVLISGWANAPTLTIDGGEHYLVFSLAHMMGGGLLETRYAATLDVTGATVYISNGSGALNAHSFNSTLEDKQIDASFTGCKLISSDGVKSVLGYANENTKITFEGCEIYGSITTTVSSEDAKKEYGPIKNGNIILGGCTLWGGAAGATMSEAVVCKSGDSIINIDEY